jgi:hypothetical protein
MNKVDLLRLLSLKAHRADLSSNIGSEPGMLYWQGQVDAIDDIYALVDRDLDG